jgi:hypothetical protein
MSYKEKLPELRHQIFQQIGRAAREGDTREVNRLARLAKDCDDAGSLDESLSHLITRITVELAPQNHQPNVREPDATLKVTGNNLKPADGPSPRQKANQIRTAYVNELSQKLGYNLRRRSEIIYETQSGKVIGMPYARELGKLPDRWWLGVPDERFDFLVLLCETSTGDLLDFVLPPDFVKQVWNSLSRDSNGYVKVNVFKTGLDYELRPEGVPRKIRRFLKRIEMLA